MLKFCVYKEWINRKVSQLLYAISFGIGHGDGTLMGSFYSCLIYSFPNVISQMISHNCGIIWSPVYHMMNNILIKK